MVNNTARGLAKIARELASADYADFAEISSEILEASDAVDEATGGMDKAILELGNSTTDRKQSWNLLVDSCRVMSGKTIRLLQIVYGADLKRLQLTADQLMNDLGNINTNNLKDPSNQQDFANQIQPLVGKALKLANYVKDRADDNDSPFSRDLLKKASDDLREAANNVIAAGNAALQNPELAPQVDEALGNLRRAIGDAQNLVDETSTDGNPKLNALEKLAPALDRAIAAVKAVPPASDKGGEPYKAAEKEVREAVGDVVRKLKLNPKTKRQAGDVDDGLKTQLLKARRAQAGGSRPELDDATKWLLDALNGLYHVDDDKPKHNPDDLNEFQKALQNLRKTVNPDDLYPNKKVDDAWDRLNNNVKGLRKAVNDQDPGLGTHNLKDMWGNGNDLAQKIKDEKPVHPTPRYIRQEKASDDMLKDLLPNVIRKGKPAMVDPNDAGAAEDLLDALRRLRRGMGRMEPKDEKDMRDNWADLLANLKKVRDKAEKGEPVDEGLEAIKNALKNLRRGAERRALQRPDNKEAILGPMKELDDLGDRFKGEAKAADLPAMDKTIPEMEDAWNRLNKAANAESVGAIQDLEDAMEDVMASADLASAPRLVSAAKDTLQKLDVVDDLVKTLADPASRAKADQAMAEIRPGIKDFIAAAREAVKNPDDRKLVDQTADVLNRLKKPIADLKEAFDPQSRDRLIEGAGAAVKRALEALRKANESGDPKAIREALQDLKEALAYYNGLINGTVDDLADTGRKKILEHEKKGAIDLEKDVARADPLDKEGITRMLDSVPAAVDDFLGALRNDEVDDAVKGGALANHLAAEFGALDGDDMDLGDLLGTAGTLSSLLRGMVKGNGDLAEALGADESKLTDTAKAAIAFDRSLRKLEGNEPEEETVEEVSLAPPAPPASVVSDIADDIFEKGDITSDNVEDLMSAVAYQIHEQAKSVSAEADAIAAALQKLAKAAREGQKQEMLLAAREVAAHINAFCKELATLGKSLPGKNRHQLMEADRLIRASQGLRTFGTQLKILTSVKAASIEENRDNDESLSTITTNLGNVLTQALTGMASVQKTMVR
eukprot:TRINITY_DN45_c1_g1_i1.p1 TRINITY_DN45_c1_g1~~TRINITY_DN45_c1_g1_i1.p1  ORF type:complete len:1121 (+),score=413.38 TRINITY_DN45_c1_g1_i1:168-3365(+)